MTTGATLNEMFDLEAEYPPLAGNRTGVFISRNEPEELQSLAAEDPIDTSLSIPFIGRRGELQKLRSSIKRKTPLIFVSGVAGVGKTALVQQFIRGSTGCSHVSFRTIDHVRSEFASGFLTSIDAPPSTSQEVDDATQILPYLPYVPHERMLLVFDNFDHHEEIGDIVIDKLHGLLDWLRPVIGKYVTAIISTRYSSEILKHHFANYSSELLLVEPLTKREQMAFLVQAANEGGLQIAAGVKAAMADWSLGLPSILKTFYIRAEQQWFRHATARHTLESPHLCDAIPSTFQDVTQRAELSYLTTFQHLEWDLLQAISEIGALKSVDLEMLLRHLKVSHASDALTAGLKNLSNAGFVNFTESRITIKRPLMLSILRALTWHNSVCESYGRSRISVERLIHLVATANE
jgi:hypothetical protein